MAFGREKSSFALCLRCFLDIFRTFAVIARSTDSVTAEPCFDARRLTRRRETPVVLLKKLGPPLSVSSGGRLLFRVCCVFMPKRQGKAEPTGRSQHHLDFQGLRSAAVTSRGRGGRAPPPEHGRGGTDQV
ncbi:uncharacterized protein LOC144163424 [Haemaphysalis longicornis]